VSPLPPPLGFAIRSRISALVYGSPLSGKRQGGWMQGGRAYRFWYPRIGQNRLRIRARPRVVLAWATRGAIRSSQRAPPPPSPALAQVWRVGAGGCRYRRCAHAAVGLADCARAVPSSAGDGLGWLFGLPRAGSLSWAWRRVPPCGCWSAVSGVWAAAFTFWFS
jgi:hypothetical protein